MEPVLSSDGITEATIQDLEYCFPAQTRRNLSSFTMETVLIRRNELLAFLGTWPNLNRINFSNLSIILDTQFATTTAYLPNLTHYSIEVSAVSTIPMSTSISTLILFRTTNSTVLNKQHSFKNNLEALRELDQFYVKANLVSPDGSESIVSLSNYERSVTSVHGLSLTNKELSVTNVHEEEMWALLLASELVCFQFITIVNSTINSLRYVTYNCATSLTLSYNRLLDFKIQDIVSVCNDLRATQIETEISEGIHVNVLPARLHLIKTHGIRFRWSNTTGPKTFPELWNLEMSEGDLDIGLFYTTAWLQLFLKNVYLWNSSLSTVMSSAPKLTLFSYKCLQFHMARPGTHSTTKSV